MDTEKNYTEPEEKNTDESTGNAGTTPITEIKDPLDEVKINRGHTSTGLGQGTDQPMPEYTINPNITPDQGPTPGANVPGAEEEEMPPYEDIKAQQEKKMSPEEEKKNAEETANFLMEMYGELWRRGGNLVSMVGDRRMRRMEKENEGILDMQIAYGGGLKPVRIIFEEFDAFAHNKIQGLSEKEKDLLRPIIAAELAKRGAILTPWMYALIVLLKHAYRQLGVMREMLDQRSMLIDVVKANYELAKRQGFQPHAQPAYSQPVQPEAPQQEQQATSQPVDAMEETTGVSATERTARHMRNINRQNRQRARKVVAASAPPKRKKYTRRKPVTPAAQ